MWDARTLTTSGDASTASEGAVYVYDDGMME